MIIDIRVHEKSKGRKSKSIYNLGAIIEGLESEQLTPEIEKRLKILKELKNQLSNADENIVDLILDKDVKKAISFSRTQSARASKPRKTAGITPEDRKKRNIEICWKWKENLKRKYPLNQNSFAKRQSKTYNLSSRYINKIIALSK